MQQERCTWTTKDKKQCSRNARIDGFCTQHHRMSLKLGNVGVVAASPIVKKAKTNPYEKLPIFPPHEDPKFFICWEHVSREDDALFDCSYYVTGKHSCFVHYECAKGLRKLTCPGCLCPVTAFLKPSLKDEIEKHMAEDNAEKKRLEETRPNIDEIRNILGGFIAEDEENEEDDSDEAEEIPILPQPVNEDAMLVYAMEYLPIYQNEDVVHQVMHMIFPGCTCEEANTAIRKASDFLKNV